VADVDVRIRRDDADRRIRALAVGLSDLRPFWPMVVPLFIDWMRQQFETEGAFGGRPWSPLSPAYALFKSSVRPGRKILYFDGDLRRAASQPRRVATPTRLTLIIDDPKAIRHQEGTDRMPARPIIFGDPLPPQARTDIDRAAGKYVRDLLGRF
jgi:hypothetical protein